MLLLVSPGGVYVCAICVSVCLLWPLSSKRFMVNAISFCICSGEEQMRWMRHSSPLNVAVTVDGCWQDCGFIVMFVFDGFLCICVEIFPLVWRVSCTSKKAMEPSFSSSLVNWTRG